MKGLQSIYNILIFLFGGITFLFLLYLFFHTAPFMKGFLDMTIIGQIGDFIGGFLGTILTGITLILLIWSNQEQRRSFDKELAQLQEQFNEQKVQFDLQFSYSIFQSNYQIVKDITESVEGFKDLESICNKISTLAQYLRGSILEDLTFDYNETLNKFTEARSSFISLENLYSVLYLTLSESDHSEMQKNLLKYIAFKKPPLNIFREAVQIIHHSLDLSDVHTLESFITTVNFESYVFMDILEFANKWNILVRELEPS